MPQVTSTSAVTECLRTVHLQSNDQNTPSSSNGAVQEVRPPRPRRNRGRGKGKNGGKPSADHIPSDGVQMTAEQSTTSTSRQPRPKENGKKANPRTGASHTNPNDEIKAQAGNRRKQFGGKLSGNAPAEAQKADNADTRQKPKAPLKIPAAPEEPIQYADLRSRLIAELASGQCDCVVCYSTVTTRQATWSCTQCYTVLHLGCVRKWAEGSVKKAEEYNAMQEDPEIRSRRGTWRCPGCQLAREDVPKTYWCWCGKVLDPQGGRSANPHGCGQRCSRGKCAHGCADSCHPGPCPPCAVTVSQKCFCGSLTIPMRCSQTNTKDAKLTSLTQKGTSCGSPCGSKLDCGVHTCQDVCHPGSCQPCAVQLDARCYCGQNAKRLRCGDGLSQSSYDDQIGAFEGLYACHEPCRRNFDCDLHRCSQPCHPRPAARSHCPASPDLVKTCPCGAQPVAARKSCQDAIPTCGSVCSKPFPCGHSCPVTCHLGPCPPCLIPVSTPCRCGETKQSRPCYVRQREEHEGAQEVVCNTTCRAQRHCGKHQCGRQCCPLYFQAKSKAKKRPTVTELQTMDPAGFHECSVPCSKPLSCGSHECPMACHRGACPPCLQASFEELACHCGRTVLEPPVPCGTQVKCNFPCVRPAPLCGHPKLPHDCHEEDGCPPCVFLTDKVCHCQKNIVKHVPCSRSRVSCGQACEALLNCGFHRCQGICHDAPGDCAPCTQTCGKPRKLCQHACLERCHAPSSCPETEPCEAVITLQCPCGNLQSRAKCGVSIHSPNKEKQLKCNDSCLIAQRNAKLAEALGLNPAERSMPASYDYETLSFYAIPANRKFCDELEVSFNDFIRSPRSGMILPPSNKFQRKFTHELAGVYKLASESVDHEPRRSVSVRRKQDSRIPTPLISEAFAAAKVSLLAAHEQQSRPAGLAQLRRPTGVEAPKPFNAIYLPGVFGHDEDSLRAILLPILRTINFAVTWKGDEDVVVTSLDSPTRLVMMKTELKNLIRQESFARDVILCTIDSARNVVRREDEAVPAQSRSAWGSSSATRLSSSASTGGKGSSLAPPTGNRGWAAVASGSGRNSPSGFNEPTPVRTMKSTTKPSKTNGGSLTGVVPNPNAPNRPAGIPMETASQSDGPTPESWEDE